MITILGLIGNHPVGRDVTRVHCSDCFGGIALISSDLRMLGDEMIRQGNAQNRANRAVQTTQRSVQEKFSAALDRLMEQVKLDRSILAAILCGSLSHDKVWAKSDIDLVLVTIDDKGFAEPSEGIA